jgi:hypothetical protein
MKDIFIRTWVGWQAHNFTKYFGDIYSKYITAWAVIIYATSDATWATPYAHRLRSGPTEWIIRQIAHKRKSANILSYSKQWISFSYHLLPIIHAYNAGTSRLWSHITAPIVDPDSSRTAWLGSNIAPRSSRLVSDIAPRPSRLVSDIASMTQQRHYAMAKLPR